MNGRPPAFLITGATGFLGRHILESLRRQAPDARLLVLVRDAAAWESMPWRAALGPVDVITGPLIPADSWRIDPRLDGLTGIFHLAAQVRHSRSGLGDMVRTNVEGLLEMVQLAGERKCRLLFASSSGTVSCDPRPGRGVYEDAPFREDVVGNWPYYASKIQAEKEGRRRADELGVKLIIFRPPVLLGPGDHRFRSTSNVLRLLRGKLPFILNGGMHFVDVRDAADAMVRAMQLADPQPVYHLRGTACTLDEFFRMVAKQAGLKPSWKIIPNSLARWLSWVNDRAHLGLHVVPDPVVIEMAAHYWDLNSRYAERDLAYRSRPADETIADTVAWIRENYSRS